VTLADGRSAPEQRAIQARALYAVLADA